MNDLVVSHDTKCPSYIKVVFLKNADGRNPNKLDEYVG